jgi:hypothetical protein
MKFSFNFDSVDFVFYFCAFHCASLHFATFNFVYILLLLTHRSIVPRTDRGAEVSLSCWYVLCGVLVYLFMLFAARCYPFRCCPCPLSYTLGNLARCNTEAEEERRKKK